MGPLIASITAPAMIDTLTADRQDAEFVSIPLWCRRVGCSRDTGYSGGIADNRRLSREAPSGTANRGIRRGSQRVA